MTLNNELTKREYRKLILQELIFGRKRSLIMLALYLVAWRVLYSIAKVGQLKTNVPIFLGISFLLLLMLIHIGITYSKRMRDLENKSLEELKEYLKIHKTIRKTYKKLVVIAFILVTIGGVYYVGTCAFNFNGALSWKIKELKTDKKVKLEDTNFYTSKLEGIIDSVKNKTKMEPNLMTNSLVVKFEKDGSITSIETYIYGFDKSFNLKSGYLLYYNKAKGNKLTVHKQDWPKGGDVKYDAKNDLSIVINMFNKIPIKEDIKQWNEESYAASYKGIRNWGYNLEGIRFIDTYGKITIAETESQEIVGPSISIYSPGKEKIITPHRYVYK